MVQVPKESIDFVSVHKRIVMILRPFLLTFVVVPQVVEAQSVLKISSLSDVESKAQEGSNMILNIARYVLAAAFGMALVLTIYPLVANNLHAKEYLLGWIIAVAVTMVAFLITRLMRTVRKISRSIKFFGLAPGQFGLFMLTNALIIIVCIFKHVYPATIVSVMGAIFSASGILFKNLKREHKAGSPDYLTGLLARSATPKQIIDKHKVFNLIMKQK